MYELDGVHAVTIDIDRPTSPGSRPDGRRQLLRVSRHADEVLDLFQGQRRVSLFRKGSARLTIGAHPRVQALKDLDISPDPMLTAFIPDAQGTLDDHIEAWFLDYDTVPTQAPEVSRASSISASAGVAGAAAHV